MRRLVSQRLRVALAGGDVGRHATIAMPRLRASDPRRTRTFRSSDGSRCAAAARDARKPISPQYPLVELLVALIWLAAAIVFGPTFAALRVAVFATVMLGISLTDAQHYVIPDGFTVFGLIWVLATAIAGLFVHESTPFAAPYAAIIGACVGAGAIAIAGWAGKSHSDVKRWDSAIRPSWRSPAPRSVLSARCSRYS